MSGNWSTPSIWPYPQLYALVRNRKWRRALLLVKIKFQVSWIAFSTSKNWVIKLVTRLAIGTSPPRKNKHGGQLQQWSGSAERREDCKFVRYVQAGGNISKPSIFPESESHFNGQVQSKRRNCVRDDQARFQFQYLTVAQMTFVVAHEHIWITFLFCWRCAWVAFQGRAVFTPESDTSRLQTWMWGVTTKKSVWSKHRNWALRPGTWTKLLAFPNFLIYIWQSYQSIQYNIYPQPLPHFILVFCSITLASNMRPLHFSEVVTILRFKTLIQYLEK